MFLVIVVPTISITGIILFLLFCSAAGSAIDAYTYSQMAFHYPDEEDLMKTEYKREASISAAIYLEQIEKQRWEEKGIMFLPSFSHERPDGFVAKLIHGLGTKKVDYSPYYGNKVVDSTVFDTLFIERNVSYKGDHIYHVRTEFENTFCAFSNDGYSFYPDKHKIPVVTDTYIATVEITPEKIDFGRTRLNYKVLDYKFEGSSMSEANIAKCIDLLQIPGDENERKQERINNKLQQQPNF